MWSSLMGRVAPPPPPEDNDNDDEDRMADGWDEDDDDDMEQDEADEEEELPPEEPPQQSPQSPHDGWQTPPLQAEPQPTEHEPPQQDGAPLSGMFMGRLTRFLEHVTHSPTHHPNDDNNHDDGNGWDQEEEDLEELENDEGNNGWDQEDDVPLDDDNDNNDANGWDHEDELLLDDNDSDKEEQQLEEPPDHNPQEQPQPQQHPDTPNLEEEEAQGWNDKEDSEADLDLVVEPPHEPLVTTNPHDNHDDDDDDEEDDDGGNPALHSLVQQIAQPLNTLLTEIQELESPNNTNNTSNMESMPQQQQPPQQAHFTSRHDVEQPLADLDVVDFEQQQEQQHEYEYEQQPMDATPHTQASSAFFSAQDEHDNPNTHTAAGTPTNTQHSSSQYPTLYATYSSTRSLQQSSPHPSSDDLETDLEWHNQAVLAIQEEMQAMEEQQQQQQANDQAPHTTTTQRMVDHTPSLLQRGGTSGTTTLDDDDDPSMIPQVPPQDPELVQDGEEPPPHILHAGNNNNNNNTNDTDDDNVYDDENEQDFGLVVDHTPQFRTNTMAAQSHHPHTTSTPSSSQPSSSGRMPSTTMSMIVQAADLVRDLVADEAMDETVVDDDDDDEDANDQDIPKGSTPSLVVLPPPPTPVVDHTPAETRQYRPDDTNSNDDDDDMGLMMDPSIAVLPSEGDTMAGLEDLTTMADNETEDAGLLNALTDHLLSDTGVDYGPVVDHLPTVGDGPDKTSSPGEEEDANATATAVSLAVNAMDLKEDFQQDDAMDETVIDTVVAEQEDEESGNQETPPNDNIPDGWDDDEGNDEDDDDLDDDLTEPSSRRPIDLRPPMASITARPVVVDHTPSELASTTSSATAAAARTSGSRRRRKLLAASHLSLLVQASEEDMTRDTGEQDEDDDEDVYEDENELAYLPVVDHTPPNTTNNTNNNSSSHPPGTSTSSKAPSIYNSSVAAQAGTSAIDDATLFGDSTIAGVTTLDGTIDDGGATIDDGTMILDGDQSAELVGVPTTTNHDDDDDDSTIPKTDNVVSFKEETMVDHTPSEMGSPPLNARFDPSVAVMASIDENDSDGDGDFGYGPMVDHTPTTPAHDDARPTRSDSIIAQVNDADTVEDETLLGTLGGEEGDEDDGDTLVDDEMPSALRSSLTDHLHPALGGNTTSNDDSANVVDRVPLRPESRLGDASTLVAAEESEALSVVGDMEECGDFGLVVDQTPPARPLSIVPSGAGSTVVFAPPSVATDDLDPDETEVHGGQDGWDHEDPILEEAAPNPQSGNDEPPPNEQQLVDFLPPNNPPALVAAGADGGAGGGDGDDGDDDDRGGEQSTEASSEYAVGGAQSLLQAEDPKEDDFGPVVDHTPTPGATSSLPRGSVMSITSTVATLVTASEIGRLEKEDAAAEGERLAAGETTEDAGTEADEEKVVVDYVPNIRGFRNADSLATVGKSQFTEEDDEEEETDSKFGPVVDHLPFLRTSSISMAASRGGSTVDALGAVSEGDDSAGETDGWADDFDLDASAASDRTDRISQAAQSKGLFRRSSAGDTASSDRANVSVRFDSTVRDPTNSTSSSAVAMASMAASSSNDSTSFYDAPMSTRSNDEDDESHYYDAALTDRRPGASFAEADTPPSTPHHRPTITTKAPPMPSSNLVPTPWLDFAALNSIASKQQQQEVRSNDKSSTDGDCPLVEKLLNVDKQEGTMYGTIIAADGSSVEVDFGELLQNEMVKRRLLEQEASSLRKLYEEEQTAKSDELVNASRMVAELQHERSVVQANHASQIATLQGQLQEKSDVVDSLRAQTRELEATVDSLQQAETMAAKDKERDSSQTAVQLVQSQSEVAALKQELLELRNETTKSKEHADEATSAELSKLRLEKESSEATCQDLRNQLEECKRQLADSSALKNKLNSAEVMTADQTRQITDLQSQLDSQVSTCDVLRSETEQLNEKLRKAEKAATMAADETSNLKQMSNALQTEKTTLSQEVADLKDELVLARKHQGDEASESAEIIAKLRTDLASRTAASSELTTQLNQLKSDLSSQQDAVAAKASEDALARQQKEEKYQSQRIQLEKEIASFKQQLATEQDLRKKTQIRVQELTQELSSHAANLAKEKTVAVALVQSKLVQEEKSRSRLEGELSSTQKKLQESEAANHDRQQKDAEAISNLQNDLALKSTECDDVRKELASLGDRLKSAEEARSQDAAESKAQQSLRASQMECQQLQTQLIIMKEKLQSAIQRHSESSKKATELIKEKTELESKLASKETELVMAGDSVRGEIESMEASKREMGVELNRLRFEKDGLLAKLSEQEQAAQRELEQRDIMFQERLQKIRTLESTIREKDVQIKATNVDLSVKQISLTQAAEKANRELVAVQQERDSLQQQLVETEESLASLQRHVDENRDSESKQHHMESTMRKLGADLLAKEQRVVSLTASLASLEKQNAELSQQLAENATKFSSVQNDARVAGEAAAQESASLRQEIGDLRIQLEQTRTDMAEKLVHMESLERELSTAQSQLQVFESQSTSSNEAFERVMQEKQNMEASLSQALKDSDANYERLLQESKSVIATLRSDNETLRNQVHLSGDKIQAELNETRQELDQARNDRDMLTEENDKLLVQLGLLKEDMDASAENFARVERDLQKLESHTSLVASRVQGFPNDNSPDPVERAAVAIQTLLSRVDDLESQFIMSREKESAETTESLKSRCDHLERECLSKQAEIDCLMLMERNSQGMESQLDEMQSKLSRVDELVVEVQTLESENQRLLSRDKESQVKLESLEAHCHSLEQERLAKQEEIRRFMAMERQSELLQSQLQAMQSKLTQVDTVQSHLQTERDSRSAVESLEERCQVLERECLSKQAEIDRLMDMQLKSQAMQTQMEEMESKLSQLEHVEQELQPPPQQDTSRELQARCHELEQDCLAQQDEMNRLQNLLQQEGPSSKEQQAQIHALEQQVADLTKTLQNTQTALEVKVQELDKVPSTAVDANSTMTSPPPRTPLAPLQDRNGDDTKGMQEDLEPATPSHNNPSYEKDGVDELRNHIVSLALALQRSELQRADAMDNLTLERQAHADSLRSLAESVKRYFSSRS